MNPMTDRARRKEIAQASGDKAMADYRAAAALVDARTKKLRAQRLIREEAARIEAAAKPKPLKRQPRKAKGASA